MNSFFLSAAVGITVCSAFSVTERSCRYVSPRQSLAGLETIKQNNCLDIHHHHHRHGGQQSTELWSSSAISSNEDLLPGISVINDANDVITEQMGNLQDSPYFRLFCVDILASCEYMPQELFECYSETCEVYPVDDDEVCMI
jgi:hypothetical protein